MVDCLSTVQLNELLESFRLFDRDGDGLISPKELRLVIQSLGHNPSLEEAKEMISEIDLDGNGQIDFVEFLSYLGQNLVTENHRVGLEKTFSMLDEDGDGFITISDLRKLGTKVGEVIPEEELNLMISLGDKTGSGKLSCEDFVNMMLSGSSLTLEKNEKEKSEDEKLSSNSEKKNKSGSESNSDSDSDSGSNDELNKNLNEKDIKTKSSSESGSKSGSESGSKSESESGSKSGSESGSKSKSDTENEEKSKKSETSEN
ncbi:calmodulin-like protein [Anaeramoeba flamelloides]|uniref:Calmodulin-like protein n=1 Tax=Anaeramoeba flamelloides TaxID=1746091 RepID=A0AAV7Z083_9EUKA|nr:calmodulin-like protein [Anaeramoeba flamelloides]KAJ6241547.1 calmodulin-like protein [Anaeramoeba flamelloides]